MNIEPLKNHPEFIDTINKLCFEEFHYFFPDYSLQDFEKSIKAKLNMDKLPIFFIAFEAKELIGCFALREYENIGDFVPPLKKKYSPWLASLIVLSKFRGRGFGRLLVNISKEKTKEFGYKKLYFFTDKEEFYEKLGFKILEKTNLNNNPVSIMSCDL